MDESRGLATLRALHSGGTADRFAARGWRSRTSPRGAWRGATVLTLVVLIAELTLLQSAAPSNACERDSQPKPSE